LQQVNFIAAQTKALPTVLTVTDSLLVKDRSTFRQKKSVVVKNCKTTKMLAALNRFGEFIQHETAG
jgi:hypothetical protein